MSLRKRGSVWWIDFTAPNGERVRRATGTENKAQAQELHDKLKSEVWRLTRLGDRPQRIWRDAVIRWLREQSHKATHEEDKAKLRWLDRCSKPPDDAESNDVPSLSKMLLRLQLPFLREHYHELAQTAAEQRWTALEYLQRLVEGAINRREDSGLQRRIRLARLPVLKTLDQFDWSWPKKINRPQIQNLFRLQFIRQKSNAILLATSVSARPIC